MSIIIVIKGLIRLKHPGLGLITTDLYGSNAFLNLNFPKFTYLHASTPAESVDEARLEEGENLLRREQDRLYAHTKVSIPHRREF